MMAAGAPTGLAPGGWLDALRRPAVPQSPTLRGWRDVAMQVALAGLGFALPYSPAGVSLMLALVLALGLCSAPMLWRTAAWREPTAAIGLLLFAYLALHTALAGPWSSDGVSIVNKYHELLFFPLLLAVFTVSSRPRLFLWGLAAGATCYAIAHWLTPWLPQLALELEHKRISAGFCLALTAYLLLHERGRLAWLWRAAAALMALTVLFRIEGRTGHVVLVLLALAAAWNLRPARWGWPVVAAVGGVLVLAITVSPAVHKRMQETLAGLTTQQLDTTTSTGIRVALLANGWTIAKTHQPFGVGYGRYAEFHEPVARERFSREPGWKANPGAWEVLANNPHNEYLMQLACGGLPALLLLLAWIVTPALRRSTCGRAPAAVPGLVLAFAIGCLLNSLVLDFVEGHFYTAVLAWLLARERRMAASSPPSP